jgi:hypothetical protein
LRTHTHPLIVFAGLSMFLFGFTQGGFLGALTGFWATGIMGISLGILFGWGVPLTDLAPARAGLGIIQRCAALVVCTLTMAGVMLGGWRWGWAWSLLSWCCGLGFLRGVTTLFAIPLPNAASINKEGNSASH